MNAFDQLVTHVTTNKKPLPSLKDNPQIFVPVINEDGVIFSEEVIWVNVDQSRPSLCQVDDIPVFTREIHLYDWVRYQYNGNGEALFTDVVEASGYRSLRISLNTSLYTSPFDPQDELAGHRIFSNLNRLRLDYLSQDGVCVVAIPPSLSPDVIALIKIRHPGLLYELV